MDGNPNVGAETILQSLARHRELALGRYRRELAQLARDLSQSAPRVGLDPAQGPLPLTEWLQRCVHPADRERASRQLTDWVREGTAALEIEFRVVRPNDRKTRWLVLRGDVDGEPPSGARRVQGVVIDVTEQQEAVRQLRDHVERLQLTVVSLGLGTWESVPGTKLAIWDEQMFRLRGVESPRRTVTLEEVASYLHPDERDVVMTRQIERLHDDRAGQADLDAAVGIVRAEVDRVHD